MRLYGYGGWSLAALLVAALSGGCGKDEPPVDDQVFAKLASRGGPIAANEDGTRLASANEAAGTVTVFNVADMTVIATVTVGAEPGSVVWHPDGKKFYVVNRKAGTVTEVKSADGTPAVGTTVTVGSEPARAALSPAGTLLFVSNWVDGTVSVIKTSDMTIAKTVATGGSPFAVCVSNDGDEDEDDETVWVTDFYSVPVSGKKETDDEGRQGRVFRFSAAGTATVQTINLAPKANAFVSGNMAIQANILGNGAFPNQLYACNINKGRVYITSVSASPESTNGITDFHQNIQGFVYVLNEGDGSEDTDRTVNLNNLVELQSAPRRFVSAPSDIAFAPDSDIAYVSSLLSDSTLRVDFTNTPPVAGALGINFIAAGKAPMGITTIKTKAYIYNLVGRSVSIHNLANQTAENAAGVASSAQPVAMSSEDAQLKGQRFFFTGEGRWSTGDWVGCVGCHPFGTTDNVSWSFPTGPRQTVDTAATFSVTGVQRILNWTAIFDELHDFELNTRGVAGGVGAIVRTATTVPPVNSDRLEFVAVVPPNTAPNGFNFGSVKVFNTLNGALPDWDQIEAYVKTIRSPNGAKAPANADIAAGRVQFDEAKCQYCHGGALWSLSERYNTPTINTSLDITFAVALVATIPVNLASFVRTTDVNLLKVIEADGTGAPAAQRHTCVVRKVGTFDANGPNGRGSDEVRQNISANPPVAVAATVAQGAEGFNVPSLLGVSKGAPYLHNGAADTLEELLDPAGDFLTHLRAGNAVYNPTEAELRDLIAFVRSIDDTTATFDIPANQKFCPLDANVP